MWVARTLLVLLFCAAVTGVQAASNAELEARIVKLERMLDSRGLLGLLTQIESLQREVQQLRGELEVQSHNLESLNRRQRELYLDLDRRLQRNGGSPSGTSAGPAVPAPIVPGPAGAGAGGVTPRQSQKGLASPDERRDYDQAQSMLREGRYTEAAAGFQAFLQKYPQGAYADNARYWLGEVYYVTRQFPLALEAFGKILNDYPDSTKSSDALLKTGFVQYELKQWQKARATLDRVVKEYPGSTAARLAQERLTRMRREGH